MSFPVMYRKNDVSPGTAIAWGTTQIGSAQATQVIPNVPAALGFVIKAHPSNTGTVWCGGSADGFYVAINNGYPLLAGQELPIGLGNPALLYAAATTAGNALCWLAVR